MEEIKIKDISVQVKRSARRRTIELTIERDGSIVVYAPETAGRKEMETLVRKKLLWIHQQIGRKSEELHRLPEKEYVSGEGFYYRGRKYRLKLVDTVQTRNNGDRLQFHHGRFLMPRQYAEKGQEIFMNWYARRAVDWIPRRVRLLQDRAGIQPSSIEIRDLGFRWGSCTRKGKLLFHWRLILLPPERIDYLILHELVHLHEHNHSPAFYERLRRAAPDHESQEDWLRRNGDQYEL
ncbi:SprT family zinc-dependent metalloprotease [uncultured Desulfosarcina sp.]|uniref:M48 family metallopeptidase n=1 Tax=uncultured Desulfosarcina sp. TaxID=218289 RepID=UPI0029C77E6F|nr:SprT family zinc-dependent metalloprotease [uncultured Desulfosarcina sp.]